MNQNSFLSRDELHLLGIKKIGTDVKVSRFANFYNANSVELDDFCRIDDFCIISGNVKIGKYVHVSAYNALYGSNGITIKDFSGISPRCTIFSAMDDFSGDFLIGPNIPSSFTNVTGGMVTINKYCQIGACSVIFPSITIEEGVAVGSMSLINRNLSSWGIYMGTPAKFYKERSKKIIALATSFSNSNK